MTALVDGLRITAESPDAGFQLHHVRVSNVDLLSPSFLRVTVTGPDLDRVASTGFDQRLKLLLPLPDVGLDPIEFTDDWYQIWRAQPDERRNPMRTYTVRAVRPESRELDIDVVRHGRTGPAGAWAEDVQVGDELVLNLPNRDSSCEPGGIDFDPPGDCTTFLIAGDETAAPAIAAILEQLPSDCRGVAFVELPHPDDAAVMPEHPGIDVRVLNRGRERGSELIAAVCRSAPSLAGTATVLGQPLEDLDVDTELLWEVPTHGPASTPTGNCYAWLAGEAGVIKTLRRHLVRDVGWDRRLVAFMGYWRVGKEEDNR